MQNVYKNIEDYKTSRKCNVLLVFDDMIADMVSNRKPSPTVTEPFIRRRKLNISTVFITKSYFIIMKIPNQCELQQIAFNIMKIPNQCELQQIAFNHLSDIGF